MKTKQQLKDEIYELENEIYELENEIYELERKEHEDAENARKLKNYENFKDRPSDWVIGRAHCEPNFNDNGRHHPQGRQMPIAVSINGNCGHTYYPTAWITEATNTYFHNVWKYNDEQSFQEALNDIVQKEVERIAKQLIPTLEIMGLQSNYYHLDENYPSEKVKEIKNDIWEETKKVLDTYSDDDFRIALKQGLSHGGSILSRYVIENRKDISK